MERAIGRHEEALKRQKQACEYANRYAEISVAAYQAGMQTFDQLMEVQRDRATTWLALARVDPAAAKELRKALKEAGERK